MCGHIIWILFGIVPWWHFWVCFPGVHIGAKCVYSQLEVCQVGQSMLGLLTQLHEIEFFWLAFSSSDFCCLVKNVNYDSYELIYSYIFVIRSSFFLFWRCMYWNLKIILFLVEWQDYIHSPPSSRRLALSLIWQEHTKFVALPAVIQFAKDFQFDSVKPLKSINNLI